ncbi:LPS ABC transporter substrate-binding protein LptA [Desulfobacter vibrioformis]|uniref:LPS ABC transporter substrate-binding protein LptA n=1 Tax=Desulfobacter vibrioformis TaxID=34031 RepID=UPI000554D26B|nr:LPS ABC transporter substrate-binding protein LptA [Desulfobacter vibrioformis]
MKIVKIPICYNIASASLLILLLFFTQVSFAAQEKKDIGKGQPPADLKITSDKMVASKDQSMVEFMGKVKAVRADSVLLADSVKVFFHTSETKKKGQSNIRRILAAGHVEYTQGDRKAFSDQADYDTADEILVLTGEQARLLTGKSWITGKKITLFRAQDRVVVESTGETRVEAFFDAQDQGRSMDTP